MGSCQSAADGSSPLSVNQAGVEDIKRNITNKFQDHKNESTKKIYSAQKILIQQTSLVTQQEHVFLLII